MSLTFPVDLFSTGFDGPLRAQTRDVGLGGICVETPSVFAARCLRRVALKLPEGELPADARGRWQRFCPSQGSVLTGIAFDEPERVDAVRLWELIADRASRLAGFLYRRRDLADFGPDELTGLCHAGRVRRVAQGGHPASRDLDADSIFVVLEGSLGRKQTGPGGQWACVERLEPGRLFGGTSGSAASGPSGPARIEGEALLLEITRASYEMLSASRPWLAQRLVQALKRAHGRAATARPPGSAIATRGIR